MWLVRNPQCNKRISYAGPEWSAGRPGHTPTRRILACDKTIEDSCAGQDWLAGRPGNRPFGARSAACPSVLTACSGPYGTTSTQPHYTGPNPREETLQAPSSTRFLRPSTSQLTTASPARRYATEDRASPANMALQPRSPPYFCGGFQTIPRLDIDSRSLVRCQSGRALTADDFRCVSAKRSSL